LWENLMDFKNSNLASSIRGQTDWMCLLIKYTEKNDDIQCHLYSIPVKTCEVWVIRNSLDKSKLKDNL
jgi:hypothetical protein